MARASPVRGAVRITQERNDHRMTRHFHLIGIAGTGMGAFAGLLKQAGFAVRGSDQNVYPPMSDQLRAWDIEVRTPYAAENLDPPADLVVVGNVIRRDNVEASRMREVGLAHASFPETLGKLFLAKRHSVVVAGTHGKTTTSTLIAHTLLHSGRDPGYLIGGIPRSLEAGAPPQESFRVGKENAPFVVEGDEYDTAYFDKGPKFLHYHPRSLLCTSLEFDHADIYQSIEEIQTRFHQLVELVPSGGHIVCYRGDAALVEVVDRAKIAAKVETYGDGQADWQALELHENEDGIRFGVRHRDRALGEVEVSLSGQHGALNAVGAYAILRGLGLEHHEIAAGFATFAGVKRRMEVVGTASGVTVIDDFAHHPTAVSTTLAGARARYAGRPLWAFFEPRSATSCRRVFQDAYAQAFAAADRVFLAPPGRQLEPEIALDVPRLALDIQSQGPAAEAFDSIETMIAAALEGPAENAVFLCMSNGAFGGIHQKLLAGLAAR